MSGGETEERRVISYNPESYKAGQTAPALKRAAFSMHSRL
jgi:hypothetical protein